MNFFQKRTHTPSANIFMYDSDLRKHLLLQQIFRYCYTIKDENIRKTLGHININSLRNKFTDLKVILKYLSLGYFVLSVTKLDESFPNAQFTLDGYEIRARRDRNKFGESLIEYLRRGMICKRTAKWEPKFNECICSENTFSK